MRHWIYGIYKTLGLWALRALGDMDAKGFW